MKEATATFPCENDFIRRISDLIPTSVLGPGVAEAITKNLKRRGSIYASSRPVLPPIENPKKEAVFTSASSITARTSLAIVLSSYSAGVCGLLLNP